MAETKQKDEAKREKERKVELEREQELIKNRKLVAINKQQKADAVAQQQMSFMYVFHC